MTESQTTVAEECERLLRLQEKAIEPDWLTHLLWEHYPEGLPPWDETPLHIRQGLKKAARKIMEALHDRP